MLLEVNSILLISVLTLTKNTLCTSWFSETRASGIITASLSIILSGPERPESTHRIVTVSTNAAIPIRIKILFLRFMMKSPLLTTVSN